MTRSLTKPVSDVEIKRVVFSIRPFSALEDDGFSAKFYQFYQDLIKIDVCSAIRSFFRGGRMLKSFNHTQICLIPKVKNATSMSQIQPISLCIVFYKIISKILLHRLQIFINKLISANQSAFIKGGLISDNILVAHECMHFLKNKRYGSHDFALKLNKSKTYDIVE